MHVVHAKEMQIAFNNNTEILTRIWNIFHTCFFGFSVGTQTLTFLHTISTL